MSTSPAGNDPGESLCGAEPRSRIPLWLALAGMVLALVVAVVIMLRVAEPLYRLLFPLEVPVPDGVEEIEHVKPDKGAEYWIYRTQAPGREIATFYEEHDSRCVYSAIPQELEQQPRSYAVATCNGSKEGGGLGISWEVFIHEGYSEREGPTIFRVFKYDEVN
jgi:hypothetical protein